MNLTQAATLLQVDSKYLVIGVIALVLIFLLKTAKKIIKLILGVIIIFAIYSAFCGNPLF